MLYTSLHTTLTRLMMVTHSLSHFYSLTHTLTHSYSHSLLLSLTHSGVDVEQLDVKNGYVPRSFSNQTFSSDPRQDGDVRCEYVPRSLSTAAFDPDIVKENDGNYYVNPWEDLTTPFDTDSHNTSISSYKNPGDIGDDYDETIDVRNMSSNSLAGGKLLRIESNISFTLMDGLYDSSSLPSLPPTWAPADHFSFPISRIPVASFIESNLTLDAFTNIVHIGDGTNSNIYRAELYNQTVVVKMIKEEIKTNPVTVHEFDVEHRYSLTHSLTHSFTHSLTHLLTHSLTHLLTHSLTYSLLLTPSYSLTLTHSLTYYLAR